MLSDSDCDENNHKKKLKKEYLVLCKKEQNRRYYQNKIKKKKPNSTSLDLAPACNQYDTELDVLDTNLKLCESLNSDLDDTNRGLENYEHINEFNTDKFNVLSSSEDSFTSTEDSFISNDNINDFGDEISNDTLYNESSTTLNEFSISLFILKYKHKLSESAIDDILSLIKIILPIPNNCPKSSSLLMKKLKIETKSSEFLICSACKNVTRDKCDICTKCSVNKFINFSTFDVKSQIEKVLLDPSLYQQIIKSNSNSNLKTNNYLDSALDGEIYRSIKKATKDQIYISLNINSDGAPLIKSRSFSVWPILGSIVELNDSSRENFQNVILIGIWLHVSKPPKEFFDKSFEQLVNLNSNSFTFSNKNILVRCQAGIFDLPAKAMVANVKQFNGKFGCVACFHPGIRTSNVQLYPPDKKYNAKTKEDYHYYSKMADDFNKDLVGENKKHSFFGYFGKTSISCLLDIPEQIPFDFMHLVLQGHTKWLLNKLIFDKEVEDDIYLGKKISFINNILSSVRLPHLINRKPFEIENISKWKSSEIEVFLFYLSIPIFLNLFPSWFFYKYTAYAIAIRILYEPIKSVNDLNAAEIIIEKYVQDLEDTFSINAYSYTTHAHLHLAQQVRLHGPLHGHSQYFFEGCLFNLKNLLHGTRGHLNQISKQMFLYKDLPLLLNYHTFNNNLLFEFTKSKIENFKKLSTSLLGSVKQKRVNKIEENLFKNHFNLKVENCFIGERFSLNNSVFHSKSYKKKGKSNSYSISFIQNGKKSYGEIEYFIEINQNFYALVSLYSLSNQKVLPESTGSFYEFVKSYFFNYFKVIEKTDASDLISCNDIDKRCILFEVSGKNYLTELNIKFKHD